MQGKLARRRDFSEKENKKAERQSWRTQKKKPKKEKQTSKTEVFS